jgi:two-component system alkaline phosphatase synthesis response regulator PhoP
MPNKILIAEDEPSIVLSLEFLLRGAGYDVTVARDGKQALHAACLTRPDLIVLDIMLPELDGFEICCRVRETETLAHTKILILTARGRGSEIEKSLALGASAYMTKPFSTRELVRKIGELLAEPQPGTGQ